MTTADRKLIDEAIQKYGDDFWNKEWIILELLEILAKDDLDLKVVRKPSQRLKVYNH